MSQSCGWDRTYNNGSSADCAKLWNCIGDRRTTADSGNGYILDFFPESVTTCGDAMGIIGDELKKRIGANWVTVSYQSPVSYTISLKLGPPRMQSASVVLTPSASCKFPIGAAYTKGMKTGNESFSSIPDLMNYLVFALKR